MLSLKESFVTWDGRNCIVGRWTIVRLRNQSESKVTVLEESVSGVLRADACVRACVRA